MFAPSGLVTLLTDFGTTDGYVGQMKGVMLTISRELAIVDLTHDVPPQDVLEGAFQLATAAGVFPPGTVHVAVVDPGVGTARRAVAVLSAGHIFIGPDNGVLWLAVEGRVDRALELTNASLFRESPAATFHGRDVFAPVAARLASGSIGLEEVGTEVDPDRLIEVDLEPAVQAGATITGPVVSIDRFGNCLTRIDAGLLPPPGSPLSVECGEFRAAVLDRTYGCQAVGAPIAMIGSHGGLELSARDGNAARLWGIRRGDRVTVRLPGRT